MLFALGRTRLREGDLVDALGECHDRIRSFVQLAVTLSERVNDPSEEIAAASSRIERYFSVAFPLHVADEEASILPRLRGRSAKIDAALCAMRDQHDLHTKMVERLCGVARAVGATPNDPRTHRALGVIARPLRSILQDHMAAEEAILFPAVRLYFSSDDSRLARREIEGRRR